MIIRYYKTGLNQWLSHHSKKTYLPKTILVVLPKIKRNSNQNYLTITQLIWTSKLRTAISLLMATIPSLSAITRVGRTPRIYFKGRKLTKKVVQITQCSVTKAKWAYQIVSVSKNKLCRDSLNPRFKTRLTLLIIKSLKTGIG